MRFFSDNAASAHPAVFDAMLAVNAPDAAYDGDAVSAQLDGAFSEVFERDVAALWVATGTAANCLALAALCPNWRGVLAHHDAHIAQDEAGAPEFFSGGGKLIGCDGGGAKLTPTGITDRLDAIADDVHRTQVAAVSITNASEYGRVYNAAETAAIGALATERGLRFHVDGARFANAVVATGATPADLTWRAGADALSFGFIKNGGLGAEALVLFDPALVTEVRVRRKRAGHLASKGRFMAAQLLALLADDRWLANARAANAGAAIIARAAGDRLLHPVDINEAFVRLSDAEAAALRRQGFEFYDWETGIVRFVVSWDQSAADIVALAAALNSL